MAPPPKRVTVLVDSREKYPVLFPATVLYYPTRAARPSHLVHVTAEVVEMETGDYALKGYEDTCLIERKGAMTEISANLCSNDYARSHAALKRLAEETKHPYLMLEETPSGMLPSHYPYTRPTPDRVCDAFLREVCEFGLSLIFVGKAKSPGNRRKLGHFMLKIMLGHAMAKNNALPDLVLDSPTPPA